jgi:hypothetical protein
MTRLHTGSRAMVWIVRSARVSTTAGDVQCHLRESRLKSQPSTEWDDAFNEAWKQISRTRLLAAGTRGMSRRVVVAAGLSYGHNIAPYTFTVCSA